MLTVVRIKNAIRIFANCVCTFSVLGCLWGFTKGHLKCNLLRWLNEFTLIADLTLTVVFAANTAF